MRLLNLILTLLASQKPSTERPLSPHLIQHAICIVGLAVATGVLGSALILGAHIGLYFILVYYGVDAGLSGLIVAGIGVIAFAAVVGDLIYRVKHIFKRDSTPSEPPSLLSQMATVPEAFLQGFFSKHRNRFDKKDRY